MAGEHISAESDEQSSPSQIEAGARLRFRLGEKFLKTVKIKVSRGNDTTPSRAPLGKNVSSRSYLPREVAEARVISRNYSRTWRAKKKREREEEQENERIQNTAGSRKTFRL